MKIVLLMVAILTVCAPPARAADPWSTQDMALQAGYTVLHVIDWGQTLAIARDPRRTELNPILGTHPNVGRVNTYFAATLAAHTLVTHFLPSRWRPWWQGVTIVAEGATVGWNFAAGLRAGF